MTSQKQTPPDMNNAEFIMLRDFIRNNCGMHFAENAKYLLEKRLLTRLAVLGFNSFRDYCHYLISSDCRERELIEIMDIITVNETYFFRESLQLETFNDEVLPELLAMKRRKGVRQLRIWSAGCATGEEAYTIAMLLDIPELRDWTTEIIATDVSQRALSQAREGVYGPVSFRNFDERYRDRYFTPEGGRFRIRNELRDRVKFCFHNLVDTSTPFEPGECDIVFCRNVIIYFDHDTKAAVVGMFHKALCAGGYLFLGHSESLMNISSDFALRHYAKRMIYQKPDNGELLR